MYGTLEGANTFHSARGNAAWAAASEEARQQALQRASDYIEARYAARLVKELPEGLLEKAAYLAALIELQEPNFFSFTSSPAKPNKVLVGVGDIRWQVVNNGSGTEGWYPSSSLIEALLGPYIAGDRARLAMFVV